MRKLNLLKTQSFMPLYLPNIYLSIVNNRNIKKRCEICSKFLYCWLRTNFAPFSNVSFVDFKQINVGWETSLSCPNSVCDFQSMKSPLELNSILSKVFCCITWLLYQLIRRDTGRLVNEVFTSNPIVSSKQ